MIQLNEYTLMCTSDILNSIVLSNNNSDFPGLSAKPLHIIVMKSLQNPAEDGEMWYEVTIG